jgi:hypothetical protein
MRRTVSATTDDASGTSVDRVDCLVRADIDIGHIRRLTIGVFPLQIYVTILAPRYFSPRPLAGFQLAEPLSTTCSSTRSAKRQFVKATAFTCFDPGNGPWPGLLCVAIHATNIRGQSGHRARQIWPP